jgi:hypothetical protein
MIDNISKTGRKNKSPSTSPKKAVSNKIRRRSLETSSSFLMGTSSDNSSPPVEIEMGTPTRRRCTSFDSTITCARCKQRKRDSGKTMLLITTFQLQSSPIAHWKIEKDQITSSDGIDGLNQRAKSEISKWLKMHLIQSCEECQKFSNTFCLLQPPIQDQLTQTLLKDVKEWIVKLDMKRKTMIHVVPNDEALRSLNCAEIQR